MIKAGSAGSIPDGVTKTGSLVTHPLHLLLQEIGNAVSHLNTLVVGLDAVEQGYKKPDSIDISWNPDDPVAAARQSRKFVVEAVLVRVSEATIQYIYALAELTRLAEITSKWNGDTKAAQKVDDVFTAFLGKDYLIPAVVLLVHWRNRIIHRSSNAKLTSEQKKALRDNEDAIAGAYKGLSVDCLLCHFEERRPTLKDVSSLISICLNLARKIDESLYKDLTKGDLDTWLKFFELSPKIERVKRETKKDKQAASIKRLFRSEAPQLYDAYQRFLAVDQELPSKERL